MTVIKNQKSNTYEVRTYYKDWTGVRKQKTKRGFKRKCDAQEWERAFKLKENLSLDMYFEDFVDLYLNDIKSRIKYNTWLTKKHIVEKKILPYFSKKKLQEIKPSDIRQWQNTMMNYRNKQGEGYSQVYLKTIHNQLSAILNHAVNFYDLKSNAARKAGSMGKERTKAGLVDSHAREYGYYPEEWLPEAGTLESAKSYRKRIFPLVKKVANMIQALYSKYLDLKNKNQKLSDRNIDLENRVDRLREEISVIKKENVALLNVAYDMDRVVAVLGENKVKEAIEVAKHLEQVNAKQKGKKRRTDREGR
ncbi:tyrosine-type recombinase/integrase [Coprococcus comes]|uniref:Arm DNA-binding domain-containing protein n=1 Tax=Coprococcus comes TaxID=410072 RepID=UPI001897312A|nr:Arm DNA-binding domain-containing protein [Coprococcus comes]